MGLGADGLKTLGGLNPKQSLAHIDSTMRTVKIGAESFSTDQPDPIDAADSNDAQCVVPYIKDIMRCMRETEVRRGPAAAGCARRALAPGARQAVAPSDLNRPVAAPLAPPPQTCAGQVPGAADVHDAAD